MNWIPVSERLPEKYCEDGILYNHQRVIVTLQNGHVCEMWWGGGNENFRQLDGKSFVEPEHNPVVAWMPMPEPFMIYSLGYWDANDGKGYREHILTQKDFEDRGICEYLGVVYVESEMDEYIERYGEDLDLD
ncbi:MAG: DUF551 domain-containing protein [Bacilli bacterium]|nr:DUF551 domain-containing protein [Bacilli bacterium]